MQHDVQPHDRLRPRAEDEQPFAEVVLPLKSGRHSRPLPPPGSARRLPPAPLPPPRPEHTLTDLSRPVPPPSVHVMELVSLPPPLASAARPPTTVVSLTAPRPEPEREKNVYTEAPLKLPQQPPPQPHKRPQASQNQPVISSQPLAASKFHAASEKMSDSSLKPSPQPQNSSLDESIFCDRCGKCKCDACCQPRRLPKKWLCGGTCLCSKTTVVDALSCMCCVKGLFYHCNKDRYDEEDAAVVDNPCTVGGLHPASRWAAMTALVPVLPCLLTYPLLRGCGHAAEAVYAKCTASGCQCQNIDVSSSTSAVSSPNDSTTPRSLTKAEFLLLEKRLLINDYGEKQLS